MEDGILSLYASDLDTAEEDHGTSDVSEVLEFLKSKQISVKGLYKKLNTSNGHFLEVEENYSLRSLFIQLFEERQGNCKLAEEKHLDVFQRCVGKFHVLIGSEIYKLALMEGACLGLAATESLNNENHRQIWPMAWSSDEFTCKPAVVFGNIINWIVAENSLSLTLFDCIRVEHMKPNCLRILFVLTGTAAAADTLKQKFASVKRRNVTPFLIAKDLFALLQKDEGGAAFKDSAIIAKNCLLRNHKLAETSSTATHRRLEKSKAQESGNILNIGSVQTININNFHKDASASGLAEWQPARSAMERLGPKAVGAVRTQDAERGLALEGSGAGTPQNARRVVSIRESRSKHPYEKPKLKSIIVRVPAKD